MFYYYGRKKKIIKAYPEPFTDTIIEPFAGSAAYSLHGENWRKRVILVEKDPEVAALWRWLILEATRESILALPDPILNKRTDSFLHILHASKRAFEYHQIKATPFLLSAWQASKPYMAENVYKIKHWEIVEGDYSLAPDIEASWFIDPPYFGNPGMGYRHSSALLEYSRLAEWVLKRQGEVLVCEQANATWLPFKPLVVLNAAAGKKSTEGYYYRSAYKATSLLELFSR